MRRFLLAAVLLFPLTALTAACDDGLDLGEPILGRDSALVLAAPGRSEVLGSAVDFARLSTARPEMPQDAGAWDFALREGGGVIRLVPNPFVTSRQLPLIVRVDKAYADIKEAYTSRSAYGDTAIALTENAVYMIRSRQYPSSSGGLCYNFAKLWVKDIDIPGGRITVDLTGNLRCGDQRLVFED